MKNDYKYTINNMQSKRGYKKGNRVYLGVLWLVLLVGIVLWLALFVGK